MPGAREGRARWWRSIAPGGAALAVAAAAALVALGGVTGRCGGGKAGGAAPEPAQGRRIASLLPPASALLVALGAADRVVARAADDDTPELADRAVVGTVLAPSPEALAAVEPDLVVVWAGVDARAVGSTVRCRAEVVPLRLDRLSDVPRAAVALGGRIGASDEAARLARDLRSVLDSLAGAGRACGAPSVLWAVGLTPPVAAGPATLPDDLISAAGAVNALADAREPWPRPALEALVARDVDVLVWPVGRELPPFARVPPASPWRRLAAGRRAAVVEVDAGLVHEAGPRVADAARHLSRLLADRCGREGPPLQPSARHP